MRHIFTMEDVKHHAPEQQDVCQGGEGKLLVPCRIICQMGIGGGTHISMKEFGVGRNI